MTLQTSEQWSEVLALAHGLNGRRARELALTEKLKVTDFLLSVGIITREQHAECGESRLTLTKTLIHHWEPYVALFANLGTG